MLLGTPVQAEIVSVTAPSVVQVAPPSPECARYTCDWPPFVAGAASWKSYQAQYSPPSGATANSGSQSSKPGTSSFTRTGVLQVTPSGDQPMNTSRWS